MEKLLLVVHVLLAVGIVITVLLQRSEGGGLGIGGGGGGMGGFMTGRSAANLLTRATAVLAGLFFLTSLTLAILSGNGHEATSVVDKAAPAQTMPVKPAPTKTAPVKPEPAAPRADE